MGWRPRGVVAATAAWELAGLAFWAVASSAWWLVSGSWPGPALSTTAVLFASGPAADLYQSAPPRRRQGAAAGLSVLTVMLVAAQVAVDHLAPGLADADLGPAVGLLLGTPVAVAVFARVAGQPQSQPA